MERTLSSCIFYLVCYLFNRTRPQFWPRFDAWGESARGTDSKVSIPCNLPRKSTSKNCTSPRHPDIVVIRCHLYYSEFRSYFLPFSCSQKSDPARRGCLPDFTHTTSKDKSATRRGVVFWGSWSNHQAASPPPTALREGILKCKPQVKPTSVGEARLPEQRRTPNPATIIQILTKLFLCEMYIRGKERSVSYLHQPLMLVRLSGNHLTDKFLRS